MAGGNEPVERKDRRVLRTRRLLREALQGLILEKGYDRVTVQDILDRADVGRATFYAHFRDKDDLLVSGAGEFGQALRQHLAIAASTQADPSGDGFDVARALFEHASAHRRLYRALVDKRANNIVLKFAREQLTTLLREHLQDVVAGRGVTPPVPVEVTAHFLASALLGVLTWWLESDTPYSAEDMGRMFHCLTRPAFAASVGMIH